MKRLIAFILLLTLFIPLVSPDQVYGAATIKLNKTKLELHEGETYSLKLKGASGTVKWSSNKKSVATVSSKGKIKAIKKGQAIITATYKNKKYKCTVTVISGKKVDVIFSAYILDDSTIEEYANEYIASSPEFLDVKVYDDQHIKVTMYETDRLKMVKEVNDNLDEYISDILSDDNLKDIFTDMEADNLFQDIKLYTNKATYENSSFSTLYALIYLGILSDVIQAINLVDPSDRICTITVIDDSTGEILYPNE